MTDDLADDDVTPCHYCGNDVVDDNVVTDHDGDAYCESCANNLLVTCDWCNELHHERHVYCDGDQAACGDCRDRHGLCICSHCDRITDSCYDDYDCCCEGCYEPDESEGFDYETEPSATGTYAMDMLTEDWLTEAKATEYLSEGRTIVLADGTVVNPMAVAA